VLKDIVTPSGYRFAGRGASRFGFRGAQSRLAYASRSGIIRRRQGATFRGSTLGDTATTAETVRGATDAAEDDIVAQLERRLGRLHARQRLGIEDDHEGRVFGQGINYFHPENWYLSPFLIRSALRLVGLYGRARRNAECVRVRHHDVVAHRLPAAFDGFTILQLSDLHADMNEGALARAIELLPGLAYDLCVMTGDYRGRTFGPFAATITGLARLRTHIAAPVYAVLGNHDTIRMAPAIEAMGVRLLLNEAAAIERDGRRIYLVGIDDAHYYRVDNIEKAAADVPDGAFSILLSHTPEIYRQAAHAAFDLMLSGHTHGGQLCLPGGIPVTLDAVLPRRMGAGSWRYRGMVGYTSVGIGSCIVPVRLNCPPEITLHHLRSAPAQ
jgi:predicted MPP superfamily phosphohydrolase